MAATPIYRPDYLIHIFINTFKITRQMKKILTMAAVAPLAASCSNDKDVITPDLGTANAPVAIKLTQSVEGLTTKSPDHEWIAGWKVSW